MKRLFKFIIICVFLGVASHASAHDGTQHPFADSVKKPGDVYSRVQALNQGISQVLRKNSDILKAIQFDAHLFDHPLAPRHVYQRALDVERKLVGLLYLNSLQYKTTDSIEVRSYKPDQVYALVERLGALVSRMLSTNQIAVPAVRTSQFDKNPQDVYYLLERMDGFLLKMGAPGSQPSDYLRRARAMVHLAQKICGDPDCALISYSTVIPERLISPLDIYVETLHLIQTMDQLVHRLDLPLYSGVVALSTTSASMVSPAEINGLLGTALADMIEISYHLGDRETLKFTPIEGVVTTHEVWQQLVYTHRLIKARLLRPDQN